MNQSLRIAIAEDEPFMQNYLRETLSLLGHEVVCVATDGEELIESCRSLRPDLVVTDIRLPDVDGLDAAAAIYADRPLPIIVISAFYDPELIARAQGSHILGYLVKPIKQEDLEPTISVVMGRFLEFQAACKEANDLRQALMDRSIIEQAKRYLMKRGQLDEPAAFRRLQNLARSTNLKLVDAARRVVTAEEAYQDSETE